MGVVFTKVLWYRYKGTNRYDLNNGYYSYIDMTSFVDWDVRAGLEVKTNIATLNITNPQEYWTKITVDNISPFEFKYNDIIEIYVDDEPIDVTYRGNSSQIIFRGYIQEFTENVSESKRLIRIKAVDVTTALLNRVWAYDHEKADNLTPPQLVNYLIRECSIDKNFNTYGIKAIMTDGTKWGGTFEQDTTLNGALGDDTNGNTTVDGKQAVAIASSTNFETENGIITIGTEQIEYEYVSGNNLVGITRAANRSTRASHSNGATTYKSGYIQAKTEPTSGGHLENGNAFDVIDMTSQFIPIYEWLKKISERTLLTSNSGVNTEKRAYTFYVDRFGYVHWFYPYSATDYDLTEGQDRIIKINLGKNTIKAYNMIIFEAGQDCSGKRMMSYVYNQDSEEKELKIKYESQPNISKQLKNDEYLNFQKADKWSGGTAAAVVNYKQNDNAYPDTYPSNYQPTWALTKTTYTNTTYNTAFRTQCIKKGKAYNLDIMRSSMVPLWGGTIELMGLLTYIAGDLINYNGMSHNLDDQPLRITDVSHKISSKGWYTSLTLEEDPMEK